MSVLILGASVRSAAQSALRADFSPIAIDLFADRDLTAIGPGLCIDSESYPHGFETLVAQFPNIPWMYTGALENHPDLIDRIAALRPLWGISGAALRTVRDPFSLASLLRQAGFFAPAVQDFPEGLPTDGSWLVKPRNSAGGRSIRPWNQEQPRSDRPAYFQEKIDGISLAAIFVGTESGSTLLGITRQLIGRESEPFAYLGSVGPWPVMDSTRCEIEKIGSTLVVELGLRGLFGVDGILRPDGQFAVVEVNPRYTASVEVLELALGHSLLKHHQGAFQSGMPQPTASRFRPPAFVAKAILFAERQCTLSRLDAWKPRALGSFVVPHLADIPQVGMVFEAGDPVLTVLTRGSTLDLCQSRLELRLKRWRQELRPLG